MIVITIGICISFNFKNYKDNGEPYITPIPKTSVYLLKEDMYEEYYMIVNPPDDLTELKGLIQKYDSDNPILEETKDGKKPGEYIRQFLGETKHTPRDWKPTEAFTDDIIDDHFNDVIAKVSWKRGDKEKLYIIWEKEPSTFWNKDTNRKSIEELKVKEQNKNYLILSSKLYELLLWINRSNPLKSISEKYQ